MSTERLEFGFAAVFWKQSCLSFEVSKCRVGDATSRDVPALMAVQEKVFSVEIAVRKDLIYSAVIL